MQGDAYGADEPARLRGDFTLGTLPPQDVPGTIGVGGYNLLARWERVLEGRGSLRLQAYYDHTERDIPFTSTSAATRSMSTSSIGSRRSGLVAVRRRATSTSCRA